MLRAVVVLALVAFAVAQTSPFVNSNINSPLFATTGDQVRFVPRAGGVLAVPDASANLMIQVAGAGAGAYRVVSVGQAAQNPRAPIRTYYGNPGKERFQTPTGEGEAAAGHLVFSLDPTAGTRVIRDTRLQSQNRLVSTSPFLAVPTFTRREQAVNLNANDVVIATAATTLQIQTGFSGVNTDPNYRFVILNPQDIAGIYSSGLRLNGESYTTNLAGNINGQL